MAKIAGINQTELGFVNKSNWHDNEQITIPLSADVPVGKAAVNVYEEVPQEGVTNNDWSIETDDPLFDIQDLSTKVEVVEPVPESPVTILEDDCSVDSTGDWYTGAGVVLAFDTDHYTYDSPAAFSPARLSSTATAGDMIRISADVADGTATDEDFYLRFYNGDAIISGKINTTRNSFSTYTEIFRMNTTGTLYAYIEAIGNTAGNIKFKNFKVEKLTSIIAYDDCAANNTANWNTGLSILAFDTDHYTFDTSSPNGYAELVTSAIAGELVRISVDVKDGVGSENLCLSWSDYTESVNGDTFHTTGSYVTQRFTFRVQRTTNALNVGIRGINDTNGNIKFKNFKVEKVTQEYVSPDLEVVPVAPDTLQYSQDFEVGITDFENGGYSGTVGRAWDNGTLRINCSGTTGDYVYAVKTIPVHTGQEIVTIEFKLKLQNLSPTSVDSFQFQYFPVGVDNYNHLLFTTTAIEYYNGGWKTISDLNYSDNTYHTYKIELNVVTGMSKVFIDDVFAKSFYGYKDASQVQPEGTILFYVQGDNNPVHAYIEYVKLWYGENYAAQMTHVPDFGTAPEIPAGPLQLSNDFETSVEGFDDHTITGSGVITADSGTLRCTVGAVSGDRGRAVCHEATLGTGRYFHTVFRSSALHETDSDRTWVYIFYGYAYTKLEFKKPRLEVYRDINGTASYATVDDSVKADGSYHEISLTVDTLTGNGSIFVNDVLKYTGKLTAYSTGNTAGQCQFYAWSGGGAVDSRLDYIRTWRTGSLPWQIEDIGRKVVRNAAGSVGFDPYWNGNVALSDNNQVVTNITNTWQPVSTSVFHSSDKHSMDFRVINAPYENSLLFGVYEKGSNLSADNYVGQVFGSYGYQSSGSYQFNGNTAVGFCDTYTDGDIITIEIDLDAHILSFYKNGILQNTVPDMPEGEYAFTASTYQLGSKFSIHSPEAIITAPMQVQMDTFPSSDQLIVSNSGHTITQNTATGWWSCCDLTKGISSGKLEWTAISTDTNTLTIGIVQSTFNFDTGAWLGGTVDSYAYHPHGGLVYFNQNIISDVTVVSSAGSVIKCILDMDAGTLSYEVDGVNYGVAASGLTGTWYPAVGLYYNGTSLDILGTHAQIKTPENRQFLPDTFPAGGGLVASLSGYIVTHNTESKWYTCGDMTNGISTGKIEWEIELKTGMSHMVGIVNSDFDFSVANYPGAGNFGYSLYANDGTIYRSGAPIKSYCDVNMQIIGSKIKAILDMDAGTLSFEVNGINYGVAVSGLTGTWYPAIGSYTPDSIYHIIPNEEHFFQGVKSLSGSWEQYNSEFKNGAFQLMGHSETDWNSWNGTADGLATIFRHSATTEYISAAALSENKVIVCYRDIGASNQGTACILSINDKTITVGSPTVFCTNATYMSVVALSENKAIVCYRNVDGSSYGTAVVLSVSGTTITVGSTKVFEGAGTSYISASLLTADKVIVCYRDEGNVYYGTACVLTISDTVITAGTPVVFANAGSKYITATALSDTQALVCYQDGTASDGKTLTLTISGTSVTPNAKTTFDADYVLHMSVTKLSSSKAVICYYSSTDTDGAACVLSTSGTSVLPGTPVSVTGGVVTYVSATALSSDKVIFCSKSTANSDYGTAHILSISGDSLTYSDPVTFEDSVISYTFVVPLSENKMIVLYNDENNLNQGTAKVLSAFTQAYASNQYAVTVTNVEGQVNTEFFSDLNSIVASVTENGMEAYFAFSCGGDYWWGMNTSLTQRSLARNTNGYWEFVDSSGYWIETPENTFYDSLIRSMTNASSKTTAARLASVPDTNWPNFGNTFDIAIILKSTDSSVTPIVESVSFNYDAEVLNVPKYNYEVDMPETGVVRVKAPFSGGPRNARVYVTK